MLAPPLRSTFLGVLRHHTTGGGLAELCWALLGFAGLCCPAVLNGQGTVQEGYKKLGSEPPFFNVYISLHGPVNFLNMSISDPPQDLHF